MRSDIPGFLGVVREASLIRQNNKAVSCVEFEKGFELVDKHKRGATVSQKH